MKLTLPAHRPFSFHSVIHSHGWYQLAPFQFDEETDTLCYVLQLANGRVIELKMDHAVDGVAVETEKLDKSERREVTDKVKWMFDLDSDFSHFYAVALEEPKLARVEERALGRVLRSPTVFEDVIKTILTTNTLWGATKNMTRKLVNEFGSARSGAGNADEAPNQKAFPTPASIAAGSPEMLKEKVRVGYRANAIHQLALGVASGELDLESFKISTLPTLELRKELLKINGVGPYAAANLLMILGRHDFIPIDSYALKMVSHEWYKGNPVTAKEVETRFEKWGEFKGLAFWFWTWKYNG
jgi:3-methyladenine DNA glycosylase/8-oxoguanine DNA glycosylase